VTRLTCASCHHDLRADPSRTWVADHEGTRLLCRRCTLRVLAIRQRLPRLLAET